MFAGRPLAFREDTFISFKVIREEKDTVKLKMDDGNITSAVLLCCYFLKTDPPAEATWEHTPGSDHKEISSVIYGEKNIYKHN